MSTSPDTEFLNSLSTPPALRASVEQVAATLGASVGAWACYLALTPNTGQSPRLLAMNGRTATLPTWRSIEGASLVRQAFHRREALTVQAGTWPALALPIMHDSQAIGAALLLYDAHIPIDTERAKAAAQLAASAITSARHVAQLRLQAEQIEEQTRLREIQLSRNLIRGVIDSVPMGLALIGNDGLILAANRALSDLFGFEPAALVGMHYSATLGPWPDRQPARRSNRASRIMSGGCSYAPMALKCCKKLPAFRSSTLLGTHTRWLKCGKILLNAWRYKHSWCGPKNSLQLVS